MSSFHHAGDERLVGADILLHAQVIQISPTDNGSMVCQVILSLGPIEGGIYGERGVREILERIVWCLSNSLGCHDIVGPVSVRIGDCMLEIRPL